MPSAAKSGAKASIAKRPPQAKAPPPKAKSAPAAAAWPAGKRPAPELVPADDEPADDEPADDEWDWEAAVSKHQGAASTDTTGRLLRRALENKRARRCGRQDITVDVGGRLFQTTRDVLWAFGTSSLLSAELDDFDAEDVVLSCSEGAFESLHSAMTLAQTDLLGGIRAVRLALEGPNGPELAELLDTLGLEWLRGQLLPAPPTTGALASQAVLHIARLQEHTKGGALRRLADRSALPRGVAGFGKREPPKRGVIRVARETSHAQTAELDEVVVQLLDLPAQPWRGRGGPEGCYQPNVLYDGDRIVFDVGAGRFLHVQGFVLGLTAMENTTEEVQVHLEAASEFNGAAGRARSQRAAAAAAAATDRCGAAGRVRCRPHTYVANKPLPAQTCSVIRATADDASASLVDRAFVATIKVPSGVAIGLYHAELFGTLLQAPAEVADACLPAAESWETGSDGPNAFFVIDGGPAGNPRRRTEGRFYFEELQFLRPLGLLDVELEAGLQRVEYEEGYYEEGDEEW